MNVLALSYLFPNKRSPNYGIFVYNRLNAVNHFCNVKVIAPIPWFPFHWYIRQYKQLKDVPFQEKHVSLETYHPRFFIIPKFFKWMDGVFYLIGTGKKILSIHKNFNVDIIDVHWVYPDIITGYLFSKLLKKPIVVTIRGKEAICFGEKSFRKKIIDNFLCRVDRIVCLSQELADIAVKIGTDRNKISVISNGVDIDTFKPLDKISCRKDLDLPENNKIILSVGTLIEGKGFHKIIACMPNLIKKYPDILLYIVGSVGPAGNFKKEIVSLVDALGLQKNVLLVGARPNSELRKWYNAADLFCLATKSEGSPNVVLEALSCGCPVIASSVGGIPEIMREAFLGYKYDFDDDVALQNAITTFFERTWDRRKIRVYMEEFSWDWCARKVMVVYQDVSGKEII